LVEAVGVTILVVPALPAGLVVEAAGYLAVLLQAAQEQVDKVMLVVIIQATPRLRIYQAVVVVPAPPVELIAGIILEQVGLDM
jgi:hypothetical protein